MCLVSQGRHRQTLKFPDMSAFSAASPNDGGKNNPRVGSNPLPDPGKETAAGSRARPGFSKQQASMDLSNVAPSAAAAQRRRPGQFVHQEAHFDVTEVASLGKGVLKSSIVNTGATAKPLTTGETGRSLLKRLISA